MLKELLKSLITIIFLLSFFPTQVTVSKNDEISNDFHYGILCYEYNHIPGYCPNVVNLGDYIQSLAAMQFLPKDSKYVLMPRDSLGDYKCKDNSNIELIINGWFFLNRRNKVLDESIDPIYVSFHINNEEELTSDAVNYLKNYEPIGCRDFNTEAILINKGIRAYFSGCLTTTLDIDYKLEDNERTDDIVFCDYKFGDYPEADKYLRNLKNYNFKNIIFTRHEFLTKSTTHEERFNEAKNLLNLYAKAKLVVTTRLHCALPCLALGTPVILVNKHYDYKRFGGLYCLLNTIGVDSSGSFTVDVEKDKDGYVKNSNAYRHYADKLKVKVRESLGT